MPEGCPLPLMDGSAVTGSRAMAASAAGKRTMVTVVVHQPLVAVADFYEAALQGAGMKVKRSGKRGKGGAASGPAKIGVGPVRVRAMTLEARRSGEAEPGKLASAHALLSAASGAGQPGGMTTVVLTCLAK